MWCCAWREGVQFKGQAQNIIHRSFMSECRNWEERSVRGFGRQDKLQDRKNIRRCENKNTRRHGFLQHQGITCSEAGPCDPDQKGEAAHRIDGVEDRVPVVTGFGKEFAKAPARGTAATGTPRRSFQRRSPGTARLDGLGQGPDEAKQEEAGELVEDKHRPQCQHLSAAESLNICAVPSQEPAAWGKSSASPVPQQPVRNQAQIGAPAQPRVGALRDQLWHHLTRLDPHDSASFCGGFALHTVNCTAPVHTLSVRCTSICINK